MNEKWKVELENRHLAHLAINKKKRDLIIAAKGKLSLYERATYVLQQHHSTCITSRTDPPAHLSYDDLLQTVPKKDVCLSEWPLASSWFPILINRSFVKGVIGKPSVITRLNISGTSIGDNHISSGFKRLSLLSELDLSNCSNVSDIGITSGVRKYCPLLSVVNISNCQNISSQGMISLWTGCQRLHSFFASNCVGVTDAVLHTITTSPRKNGGIQVIDISKCRNVTSASVLSVSESSFTTLSNLNLAMCLSVASMGFINFKTSTSVSNLESVNLEKCHSVDDAGISWLTEGNKLRSLKVLILASCVNITNTSVEMILSRCPSLLELDLKECTKLTNDAFMTTDDTVFLKLRVIALKSVTAIGDAGIIKIANSCPDLHELDIRGLPHVTDTSVIEITKRCLSFKTLLAAGCGSMKFYGQPQISSKSLKGFGMLTRGSLTSLDLTGCTNVTNDGIMSLKTCINLQSLNLSGLSRIEDISITCLATFCTRISSINLSKNSNLTDCCIKSIAYGLFNTLKVLNMQYVPKLSDASLEALGSAGMTVLSKVNLSHNHHFSNNGLKALTEGVATLTSVIASDCVLITVNGVAAAASSNLPFANSNENSLVISSAPSYYKTHVKMLLREYANALRLQGHIRRYVNQRSCLRAIRRRKHRRRREASRKIVKCARGFLTWRSYINTLRQERYVGIITKLQAIYRGGQSRAKSSVIMKRKRAAIIAIQRAYRRYRLRCLKAAIDIQRVYRGYVYGRKVLRLRRLEYQTNCVSTIEAWYIKCRTQYQVRANARAMVHNVRAAQVQAKVFLSRCRFRRAMNTYRTSVIRIQTCWRQYSAIIYVSKRRIVFNAAAITIQRIYRGSSSRKRTIAYKKSRLDSAIRIQAWARSLEPRFILRASRKRIVNVQKTFRYVKTKRKFISLSAQGLALLKKQSAIVIQRHARGMLGRRVALVRYKISRVKLSVRGQNAIQCLIRKRLLRIGALTYLQGVLIRRRRGRKRRVKIRESKEVHAAPIITRSIKQWYKRMKTAEKNYNHDFASRQIQRVFRGHVGRRRAKVARRKRHLNNCATKIQAIYRGYETRKMYEEMRESYDWAARFVQRLYRGSLGRKEYANRLASAALEKKDEYLASVAGRIENHRNPIEGKYERESVRRDVMVIEDALVEFERRGKTLTEALRPIRAEYKSSLKQNNLAVSEAMRGHRKLVGVTENVYNGKVELDEDMRRNEEITNELKDVLMHIMEFKFLVRSAIKEKRVLEPQEFWECAEKSQLFKE